MTTDGQTNGYQVILTLTTLFGYYKQFQNPGDFHIIYNTPQAPSDAFTLITLPGNIIKGCPGPSSCQFVNLLAELNLIFYIGKVK